MLNIKADFNISRLKKEITKQALDEAKKRFTREINRIARGTGEHPRIKFKPKGNASFEVYVEEVSDDLRSKIDSWIKEQT